MDVKTTLETAQDTVLNKRDQQYGVNSRVTMHERIARVWSALLGTEVTGLQVALCMAGMKLIRAENAPDVEDSFVDACGYAAIAAEIAGLQATTEVSTIETVNLQAMTEVSTIETVRYGG